MIPIRRRKYTPPLDAVYNAGKKKTNVTKAITLLNQIQLDATGRKENQNLIDTLDVALVVLRQYKRRLLEV